jgi:hypothetical protein
MAPAQQNAAARVTAIDEKETGKQSLHQMEPWEAEARKRAQAHRDLRIADLGVHIGGGRFMDQADIDAIARAKLQPYLDEIDAKAEKQRARDLELNLEKEKRKSPWKKYLRQ